jgi:hypothetical protein
MFQFKGSTIQLSESAFAYPCTLDGGSVERWPAGRDKEPIVVIRYSRKVSLDAPTIEQ